MDRVALRAELISLAGRRDVAALRAFIAANPGYDGDLTQAVSVADDDSLLALLVTMASYARNAEGR